MLRRCRFWLATGVLPIQLDPPTKEHSALFSQLLRTVPDLQRIILVPYTKFALSIPHSLHLAALAGLAARDLDRVEVDFGALEQPDARLPRVAQLIEKLGADGMLLHWFHDRHVIPTYEGADQHLRNIPTTFLRITGMDDDAECEGLPAQANATVIDVVHRRGGETRRLLFEDAVDPNTLVNPAVLKYMNSHHLYRDYRKLSKFNGAVRSAGTRGHGYDFVPYVATDGAIPRLEVHFDPNNKSARELAERLKDFCVSPNDVPDLIVPIGGDGFMMQTIRKHWKRFIPFFGVNAGHTGYLLNDAAHLEELISSPLKVYHTAMLYAVATNIDEHGNTSERQEFAFNDAWIERSTGQTALINVLVNGESRLTRARGDGMLVSTAAGSTAYAIALGASPLPVTASMLQLVGSNIVDPARWKPAYLNQDVVVDLEPQDLHKRPCRAYVDGVDVGNVSKMKVRSSRVAGVQLAFSKSCDIQAKLYKLQFPRQ